jgi:hypothetical protein
MKKVLMFVMSVAILVVAPMTASAQTADVLHCDAGEVQVCTAPTENGGWNVLFDERAHPRFDCDVATETGVDLRCVAATQVCQDAKQVCEGLRGDWRWSERRCRCYQHVDDPPTTTPPSPPAPPVQPGPTPACPDCDQCSTSDLQQIAEGLDVIERRIGQLGVLAEEEVREMFFEAVNLREQANECRGEILAERATILAAALDERLDPEAHDYHDEFDLVHQHLDALDFTVENDENWCTDSFGGVLTCIVLPTVAAGAAIFLGVYYGTEWSATQD